VKRPGWLGKVVGWLAMQRVGVQRSGIPVRFSSDFPFPPATRFECAANHPEKADQNTPSPEKSSAATALPAAVKQRTASEKQARGAAACLTPSTALPARLQVQFRGRPALEWLELLAEQGIGAWQLLPWPTDGHRLSLQLSQWFALNPGCLMARSWWLGGFLAATI